MLLEGKVAIVAGVGPGLGRSTALALAREGADLVLAARTPEKLEAVAAEVEAFGRRALCVPTDLTSEDDCTRLTQQSLEAFGRIDVLVNNAFVMPPFETLPQQSVATIQQGFDINLFGPLRLCQCVIPHMQERGSGSIVMINSVILRQSKPAYGAYKMAKHALLGMAFSLAEELGPSGIRVNSVAPGYVGGATLDLVARMNSAIEKKPVEEVTQALKETLMLRRAPEPEEIANAVVFFASELSSAITGQCLDVNSGEFSH